MVKLMTLQEVRDRLKDGEDALELSIEKWERLEKALDEGEEIDYNLHLMSSTCALCSNANPEDSNLCVGCPYYEHYGQQCDDDGGHWRNAFSAFHMREGYPDECRDAFHQMTLSLIRIKESRD